MLMPRIPEADATMFSVPKGAAKHPLATASGAAHSFSRELEERADSLGRWTDLTISRLKPWTALLLDENKQAEVGA